MIRFALFPLLAAILASAASPAAGAGADAIPIEAAINGRPVHLALDTGTGAEFVVWTTVARELGLKITMPPADAAAEPGEVITGFTDPVRITIHGKTLDNTRLRTIETPPTEFAGVQGLVGWPAVTNDVVLLDVADRRLAAISMPTDLSGWFQFRIRPEFKTLCIESPARGDRHGGLILIDTGSIYGVMLSSDRWKAWRGAHPGEPVTLSEFFVPGAGTATREQMWAAEYSLDGFVLRGVPLIENNPVAVHFAGDDYAATLGMAALRRMDLIVDRKTGLAYARPR